MKIYQVTAKRNSYSVDIWNVAANTAEQALEFVKRHVKKNYYGAAAMVTELKHILDVQVYYKNPERKRSSKKK